MNTRRHSIGIIYGTSLLQGAIFVSFPSASRILTGELGLSETLYGSLYLPMIGTGALTSLFGTLALREAGLKPLFTVSLTANLVSLLGLALLTRIPSGAIYPALFAIALLFGVSLGFMGITLNTGAMRLFPGARAGALSVLHACLGFGAAGAPLLFAFWNGKGAWEGAPAVLTLGTLLLLSLSGTKSVSGFERSEPGAGHPWRGLPLRVWSRGMTTFLYGVAESTIASWSILFLTTHRNVSDSDAAWALSAFWLCMTAGRLAGTWILRRTTALRVVLTLLLGMALAFPLVTFAEPGTSGVVLYGFAGLACSSVFPILMGLASEEAIGHLPQVSSILSACLLVGLGLGSFWVGPLATKIPMTWVFRLSAVWPLLLTGALVALHRGSQARRPK